MGINPNSLHPKAFGAVLVPPLGWKIPFSNGNIAPVIGFSSFLEEKLKWGQIPSQGFGKSREFQRNPLKSWVCLEVEEHSYVPFSWEFSWENPGSDAAMTKKKEEKFGLGSIGSPQTPRRGKSQSIPFSHTGKADFFGDHSCFS